MQSRILLKYARNKKISLPPTRRAPERFQTMKKPFAYLCAGSANRAGGFTLLETIVALGVILAAVVGPVSLITSGLSDFASAKNKIIAINLAQEGIELVRAVRDANVMCRVIKGESWKWNENPEGNGRFNDETGVGVAIDKTVVVTCDDAPGISMNVPILSVSCASYLQLNPATGFYGYSGGQTTNFKRCVDIKTPPDNHDNQAPASDQMDITATVTWNEKGREKSETLRERIYDWR